MKFAKWIVIPFTLIIIITYFAISKIIQKDPAKYSAHAKYKLGSYYIPLEITGLNHQGIPSLSVLIEKLTIPLILDLGSSGEVCLKKESCNQLNQKTFLRLRKSIGFRGNEYEKKIYNIPKIQIGKISFWHPLLEEESDNFQKDAIILEQKDCDPIEKGRLGWRLFHNTNLFLDLGNSKIAICDSLTNLSKNGYPIDSFVKTPLILDKNVIQIEAKTDQIPLLFYLDTGSTWNIINTQKKGTKRNDNLSWDVIAPTMTTNMQINNTNFNDLVLHQLPVCFPFHVDAILGMEFFNKHLVFLDFSENCAYIAKNRSAGH